MPRDLLGVAPEIEELLAGRLRAKAVRAVDEANAMRVAERRRRRRRLLLSASGIAAAAVAVVAAAAALNAQHSTSATSARPTQPAAGAPLGPSLHATPATVPTLGPFDDVHTLALAAETASIPHGAATGGPKTLSGPATKFAPNATASTSAMPATAPQSQLRAAAKAENQLSVPKASGSSDGVVTAGAAACTAPPEIPGGSEPVLRATATLRGQPVVVLVFAGQGEHTVVVEDMNCKLLNLQMLR